MKQNETKNKFNIILKSHGEQIAVNDFYQFDFSEFTDEEVCLMELELFDADWHAEHENIALSLQNQAQPLAIKSLYKNAFRPELDQMDYKPLARKCTWALADIGTIEAKGYLEKMSTCGDTTIEGFALKRLVNWDKEQGRKGPKINVASKIGQNIYLNRYVDNLKEIPNLGSPIIGHQSDDFILVYQAYNPAIAAYAQANQKLGGNGFKMDRMSWIKPNFLWMMYRCGWAEKENQERVLAIAIKKKFFERVVAEGVLSSYDASIHDSREEWKEALLKSGVRIQWDPDHDPYGAKQDWRAIQIGLKGEIFQEYCNDQTLFIQDITDFVKKQKLYVDRNEIDKLMIPIERVFTK